MKTNLPRLCFRDPQFAILGNRPNLLRSRTLNFGLRLFWSAGLLLLPALALRADEELDLIARLKSTAGPAEKCAACQRLRVVGTTNSVPALATLLREERTAQAARYALEGIPEPAALAALREAAAGTSGSIQAGLIDSLGWRTDSQAVPLLEKVLAGADATNASAAASALARIGGKRAIAALASAREKVPPSVRPAVLESLLLSADQLLAGGDPGAAAVIYRDLSDSRLPERIRVASWRGRVLTELPNRPSLLLGGLAGQDPSLRRAALQVVRELNDASAVQSCVKEWDSLPADAQLAVFDAYLKVGSAPLPLVRTATQSAHLALRLAAWQALADLGDASAIPALAHTAAQAEATEREVARETLARIRGPGVREALLKDLAASGPGEKAELLRALGERSDKEAVGVLLENARTGSGQSRLAALDSLRKIAAPESITPLLEIASRSASDAECEPALKAIYAVCQASGDKEQLTQGILAGMAKVPAPERRRLLPVLAELGTPAALEAAQAAAREPEPESAKEALRVLAQWPNAAPAPRLLEIARASPDSTLQVLALRGCIKVAVLEPDSSKRLALLQQTMAAARRPEEKRQALGQIGQITTGAALETVMAALNDAALASEAGLAALSIAEKLAKSDPALAGETAEKVMAQCKTAEITRRAWALRAKPAAPGPFLQNWLVCGPFMQAGAAGAQALFDVPFGPEKSGEKVTWVAIPRGNTVPLSDLFPAQANCVAYLRTRIVCPEECEATLLLGSDDGVKAWLNGAVVHANDVDRGLAADQDMAPIHLKKGPNELMLKITQGGGGWAACARIIGKDGRPIKGLKAELKR